MPAADPAATVTTAPGSRPAAEAEPVPQPRTAAAPEAIPVEERIAGLSSILDRRGREIDELQIEMGRDRRSILNPANIAAFVAVVVSIVSIVVSYINTTADQVARDRARLTTIVQSIADHNFDFRAAVAENPNSPPIAQTQDYRPALNEASFLINNLESSDQPATPAERIIIGTAYADSNDYDQAAHLATEAEHDSVQQRRPLSELLDATYLVGRANFASGDVDDGRRAFGRVVSYLQQSRGEYDALGINQSRLENQLTWVDNELRASQCGAARSHVGEINAIVATFSPRYTRQFQAKAKPTLDEIRALCPG